MKLFIATNSGTLKTLNVKLLEKTLKTAVLNTNFEIYLIFDGDPSELDIPNRVNVIQHRHRAYDTFKNHKNNTSEEFMNTVTGTFLRTEIPFLCETHDINASYYLYTDYDVLFQKKDYSDLERMRPKFFAAAPEFGKDEWSYVNTGVIVVNNYEMMQHDELILNFIKQHYGEFKNGDQPILNYLFNGLIEKLPLEYNWKPYWGINDDAKIIHLHGAKPRSVEPGWRYELPEIARIRDLDPEGYEYYNTMFERV